MLVSIVERFLEKGEREIDRHGAWEGSIHRLRADIEGDSPPGIPQLRGYLNDLPNEQRSQALLDLVAEHLRSSWKAGKGLIIEDYLEELAGESAVLAAPETLPADLVEDEFLARYQAPHGDNPLVAEYARRFPGRPDISALLEDRFFDEDRYVRLHKCGCGAMGEVWEIYDFDSSESIATKTPATGSENREEALRQFRTEVAVTADLEHPGIVHLHERRRDNGNEPLYTMRLAKGELLSDLIETYHRPSSDRTARQQTHLRDRLVKSLADACDIVTIAHAGKVIHRDLKPGNIVIEPAGDPAILDWGMAQRFASEADSRLPSPGASGEIIAGTPDYMPPEQADGIADPRSDIFGLGASLYEILTGRAPHDCSHLTRPADWRPVVRAAAFPAPRRVLSRIPRALDAICRKALARIPGDRYETAAQLAEDLRSFLAGKPVSARRGPMLSKAWRWCRRRP